MDGITVGAADPITRQLFDDTISALRQSVNDLRRVVDALDKRIEDTQKSSHADMLKHLDERLASERKAREEAIARVERDVVERGRAQDKKLEEMDSKLDLVAHGVERINGTLGNFAQVLEVRDQATRDNLKRIEKLENGHEAQDRTLALVTQSQAAIAQDLRSVTARIFGSTDKPDEESVLRKLENIGRDVRSGFVGQAGQIDALHAAHKDEIERISAIESKLEAQAKKWEVRRAAALDFAKGVASSRYFWAVTGVAIAGIVTALVPEAKEIILQVLVQFLGGHDGG